MNNKIKFGIVGLATLLITATLNPISINDAGEKQIVQTLGGDLWLRSTPGMYWSGFKSKVTTYPNNVTIQYSTKKKASADADYHVLPSVGKFSEGDKATLSHTVKWDLPASEKLMLALHKTYTNIDNLATTTLSLYQAQTASYSTQRLSSEAHYSGGESQLNEYFQDQLREGLVLLVTETKTRKLEDGTTKTYIQVEEQKNADGTLKRSTSDVQEYGLVASFTSIDNVMYDKIIDEKLKDKIRAASDESTAKQELITAQQIALTEKAKGEQLIAKTRATEESAKLQAVIRAEKEAAVAAENLKRDKLRASAQLAIKKANAEGDRLKVAAGLSPLERANIEKETAIGVAKALAGPNGIVFPTIVAGGNGKGGGALQTMELKMFHDLAKDLSKK